MPSILVRNLDEEALKGLKNMAAANKRSLQAEVKDILEGVSAHMQRADEAMLRIRAMFKGRKLPDTAAIIRGDRAR